MSETTRHADWLNLMEVSGPFLAEPVLDRAFPQGLEQLDPLKRKILRQAYDEWREALDLGDAQLPELHRAWIDLVLKKGLELDEDGKSEVLRPVTRLPETTSCQLPEYGIALAPDYAVVDDRHEDKSMMLIRVHDPGIELDVTIRNDGWATTPADRMVHLCRATKTRLGLITNGERWMLVDVPEGGITTYASWYSRLWGQEPVTLQSFVALLGIRRFFVDTSEQLPALFDESLKHQDEVTESLGEQVRRAVEVLIQALDRADVDRNRELLHGIEPAELYEAGLTVMMRLVFLLCAEERDLLLLGDERYEADYAISTLRMQLRGESEEVLERRWDAWSRLLSVFRAVYGGIEHETLRLPALGGSLFDPDRFPFLEGRAKGTNWRLDEAKPLPIDNRTVLLLLEAIQMHQGRTLSYRALDVEQIGYVYEGLLERTAVRAKEVTLDLDATKSADNPWVSLGEVESAKLDGIESLEELFRKRLGSSISRVRNELKKLVDESAAERLLTACHGDQALRDRIRPYFHLLRTDRWGYPLVYPKGAFMVTTGSGRRETGTHYTPKSLTEAIVAETLTPVVYVGPAEGKPREKWALKSPVELLDLKICDPAMGSGAFLVQVCRWLAERLVEAWSHAEVSGKYLTANGEVLEKAGDKEPLPRDPETRMVIARRLIAERCLYGVDLNPLAVELAKLSVWLVTLAKGRPFGFLDHNLHCGDSLLGINRLDQITELNMKPGGKGQQRLFGQNIKHAVREAIELRQQLRAMPIRDIRDIEAMSRLDADARRKLEVPELIADAFIGEAFSAGSNDLVLGNAIESLAVQAEEAVSGDHDAIESLIKCARSALSVDLSAGKHMRKAFHWPLEFPEVFNLERKGFDSIVGNPPFLGGTRISGALGERVRDYLAKYVAEKGGGQADLVAYFFLQSTNLLAEGGCLGLLATNSIAEGDTRQVGLESILINPGVTIYCAYPNEPWPGKAAVVTSRVHIKKGVWLGSVTLSGKCVNYISAFLSDVQEWSLKPLHANANLAFEGSYTFGDGFTLSAEEAQQMIVSDKRNEDVLYPYINGKELNTDPKQLPGRWVINFFDWPEAKAKEYAIPFKKILEDVRPERANVKNKEVRKYPWWLHWRSRPALYHAIGRGEAFDAHPKDWKSDSERPKNVLVSCRVAKHPIFCFVPNRYVYSNAINVFSLKCFFHFACLQSSIHVVFVWKYASKMKNDIRYTPGDVFMPFPWPDCSLLKVLDPLGEKYHNLRAEIMSENGLGLTMLYNLFHSKVDNTSAMNEMRNIHRDIDNALVAAYRWSDIDLSHDFHEVPYLPENDRVRFTISEPARLEVLRRLSELNRQRYEQEIGGSSQGGGEIKTKSDKTRKKRKKQGAQSGFDFSITQAAEGTDT